MTKENASSAIEWRQLGALCAAGVGLRMALLAVIFTVGGETWSHYLSASDAGSYLQLARVIFTHVPSASLTLYDSRVFPGWPLAYGWLLWLLPAAGAALGALVISAALVPVAFYFLTRNLAAAWAMVWLPPAWLLATVHPIAEAFYLLCGLAALLAWRANRLAWAGFAVGVMCATKPYGVALALPLAWAIARRDGRWAFAGFARFVWPVVTVGASCAWLNHLLYHDVLHQLRVYAAPLAQLNLAGVNAAGLENASGHWGAPFAALLNTPRLVSVPLWKLVYIYAHVAALGWLLLRPWLNGSLRNGAGALAFVLFGWLALNSAAIVCGGPYWGFHSFDRYFVWAWPAALALNADLIGRYPRLHALAAVASVVLTLFAVRNHA
jgi:hypothetical protein